MVQTMESLCILVIAVKGEHTYAEKHVCKNN